MADDGGRRTVRPFEWGLEWIEGWPCSTRVCDDGLEPSIYLDQLNQAAVEQSDEFFAYRTPSDFRLTGHLLRFTSPVSTPHPENNLAHAQWFPVSGQTRKAVIVLPHWNAQSHQHAGLCRLLNLLGLPALRVSLPYHDFRMPPELERADYSVSPNVARTVDAGRQAVIDTRCCLDWLQQQGYEKFGIVGTSLGSCYAFLTSAHDARLQVNVFNLFSLHFADVVWYGLSTRHVGQGLKGNIELEQLRQCWAAITPLSYMDHFARFPKKSLFIYAAYDTTFFPQFAEAMLEAARLRHIEHEVAVLPCGHYTLGRTPFQVLDAYHICSFFKRWL
ncbi:MAG: abhydrolase domain-containing 18 [Acidobacteria bacterium]|nr:abhydrolase domain-containing 18 [Acidobacteriota bacterium]